MKRDRTKFKGRRDSGTFFQYPHAIVKSVNYISLSHIARSLLVELSMQFNGNNNGDLTATMGMLSKRGWVSSSTVSKHLKELIHFGFIVLVQQGGINVGGKQRPNLYALSWLRVDKVGYSDGFEAKSSWKVGDIPRAWKEEKPPFYKPKAKRKNPKELRAQNKLNSTSCSGADPSNVLEMTNRAAN